MAEIEVLPYINKREKDVNLVNGTYKKETKR